MSALSSQRKSKNEKKNPDFLIFFHVTLAGICYFRLKGLIYMDHNARGVRPRIWGKSKNESLSCIGGAARNPVSGSLYRCTRSLS